MEFNFDKTYKFGLWEVGIDTAERYGHYDHDLCGEGGGLWFDPHGETLELVDFDGRAILPKVIVDGLRAEGYILDEFFD